VRTRNFRDIGRQRCVPLHCAPCKGNSSDLIFEYYGYIYLHYGIRNFVLICRLLLNYGNLHAMTASCSQQSGYPCLATN